jgi:multidrug efflux system membrane fusion protein
MRDIRITSLPAGVPSWRKAAWIALMVLLALGAAWWLYHRASGQSARTRGIPNAALPVVAQPVSTGNINIIYNALGTVTSLATVTVRSQINGQITQIAFTEGQMVKQGDLLAVVDPRPYELQLEQAQGTLAKDQALLKQAQADLARYQILAKQDSIAQQTVDDQAHLVDQDMGQIKVDQGAVDNAKLNLAYCHIVAPVSGRAGLRQVDLGNYVTSGDASGIVVVTQIQPITVMFALPEDNLPTIMQRLASGATLQVVAFDRANTTKLATGSLAAIDSQIDTTTGTVKMKAQFDNKDGGLFPNQFVNVQLLVNTLQNTTVVPTSAVQRGAPGTYVYVVKPDNTVAMTPIKIGPTEGEWVSVTSGITAGTQVVVDGADKLKDNAKIVLRQESPKVPTQAGVTGGQGNPTPTSGPAPDLGNGAPGSEPAGSAPIGNAPTGNAVAPGTSPGSSPAGAGQ